MDLKSATQTEDRSKEKLDGSCAGGHNLKPKAKSESDRDSSDIAKQDKAGCCCGSHN